MLLLALSELALGRWVDGLSGGLLLRPHERLCCSASVKHSHTRGHMLTILWPRVPADRELALGLAPVAKGIPCEGLLPEVLVELFFVIGLCQNAYKLHCEMWQGTCRCSDMGRDGYGRPLACLPMAVSEHRPAEKLNEQVIN